VKAALRICKGYALNLSDINICVSSPRAIQEFCFGQTVRTEYTLQDHI
jgi:hypothetical protein